MVGSKTHLINTRQKRENGVDLLPHIDLELLVTKITPTRPMNRDTIIHPVRTLDRVDDLIRVNINSHLYKHPFTPRDMVDLLQRLTRAHQVDL
jgi:hypothetical protein